MFLELVIGLVVGAVTELLPRSVARGAPAEANAERTPSALEILGFTQAFERWTESRKMRILPSGVAEGSLAGVPVRIRPGLGGSRPSGVELEMTLAHDDARVRLLTRDAGDTTPLGRALATAFTDPRLENLRSIAVVPGGLRARLLRLSPPEDLDVVVEVCAEAVRSVHAPTAPYR